MFEKILVGVDFSTTSRNALHAASQVAARCRSKLMVAHVITFVANLHEASRFIIPGGDLLSNLRKDLEEFVQGESFPDLQVDVLAHQDAAAEMLSYSRQQGCQLIVAGSHGHSGFMNIFLGNTTQKMMRSSPVPVMIIPSGVKENQVLGFENIVVPIDFSPVSLRALRLAASMAENWNAMLHVLHVIDPDVVNHQHSAETEIDQVGDLEVTPTVRAMLQRMEFAGSSKVATLFGDPHRKILDYADAHHADFLIMGSHGRKGLDRVLIGSTTAPVVRHAHIPVLTVCEPPAPV